MPELNVVHEDGRKFVESAATRGEKWDFVIHDVFTGGSVPPHLFTTEMWTVTKTVLAENGVVAVVFPIMILHINLEYGWFA